MKKVLKSIFLLVATLCFSISCSEEAGGGGGSGIEELLMKVNGVDWVADYKKAGYIQKSNNRLNISGRVKDTDDVLTVTMPDVPTTGTYTVNLADGDYFAFKKGGSIPKIYSVNSSYPKSRATVVITQINTGTSLLNYVEGTFTGVLFSGATDSLKITNGVFRFE